MHPFISILLPIRNEEKYIHQTMDSILAQEYPADRIEILIADGMSTDATREIIHQYQQKHHNISMYDNPMKIVPTGLNILIRKAKGEILIRVDGHCIIDADYVRNCVKYLAQQDVDGVGGPMHTIGENHLSEVIAIGMSSKFGVGGSSFRTERGITKLVDSVPFPAYKRAIVSLYDEELVRNQDDEYNYRIRETGGKILLAADVRSTYYSRGTLQKLWKQYYQYGFWKVRVLQKHPLQMRPRQFVPALLVSSLVFLLAMALFSQIALWLFLAAISMYITANLFASVLSAARSQWKYFPLLPLVFAILHFSYGCGFLLGLVHFWNRWGDKVGKTPPFHSEQA